MSRGFVRSPPSRIEACALRTTSPVVVIATTLRSVAVSVRTMAPVALARTVPVSFTSMASAPTSGVFAFGPALPIDPAAFRVRLRAEILVVSVRTPSRMLPLSAVKTISLLEKADSSFRSPSRAVT
ncbi:hypothetical protein CHKEEEPN_1511 [Methylorubrum podarium]|nr:hypothetical protein CHKEEEPN_1511 [Methylorubrum podarium]